jgi:hypothetical protein
MEHAAPEDGGDPEVLLDAAQVRVLLTQEGERLDVIQIDLA